MLPFLDHNQKIPAYGVMMFAGIFVCALIVVFLSKNSPVKREDKIYGSCFALCGGILGAKLLAILTSINLIIKYNISAVDLIKNGFVFYGGLIGGAAGLFAYAKMYKLRVADFFDFAALALPAGQVFGRIGCFLAGCCYGRPTSSFLGVRYTLTADPNTPLNVPLLPVQLFESAYCLVIFALLFALSRKKRPSGLLTAVYAISYSVCRFVNEFFRYDSIRGFLWIFSTSQVISLVIFALAVAWLVVFAIKKRRLLQLQLASDNKPT